MEYRFLIFNSKQKVLKAMISNYGPLSTIIACGDLEPAGNVSLDKLGDVFVFDTAIGFRLYPLAEIINGHEHKFFLRDCDG